MKLNPQNNNRILVIDDNHAIHEDIRRILIGASDVSSSLEEEASLFGETMEVSETPVFKIDSAYQGQEGLALVEKSLQDNKPYALAFVDVHMPPGWDGIEATCKIWDRYPELQVIIITAHSDHTWEEMLKLLGYSERMLVLKKPFDNIEVLQMTLAMTKRWQSGVQARLRLENLEKIAEARNVALKAANKDLIEIAAKLSVVTESGLKDASAAALPTKPRETKIRDA